MTFHITLAIRCDHCNAITQDPVHYNSASDTRSTAPHFRRQTVNKLGWTTYQKRRKGGSTGDICPKCKILVPMKLWRNK